MRPGYAEWTGPAKQRASGTITLIRGPHNIIVDTGCPTDKDTITSSLHNAGLEPANIEYVICTHGHSDHISNNNLFPQATFIVSYDVSNGDTYTFHNFARESFKIDEEVEVIATPGHTMQDVSVLVKTSEGLVAVAGDLFERKEDLVDEQLWKQFSEFPDIQTKSRKKVLAVADYIVPGHGEMFKVTGGKESGQRISGITLPAVGKSLRAEVLEKLEGYGCELYFNHAIHIDEAFDVIAERDGKKLLIDLTYSQVDEHSVRDFYKKVSNAEKVDRKVKSAVLVAAGGSDETTRQLFRHEASKKSLHCMIVSDTSEFRPNELL